MHYKIPRGSMAQRAYASFWDFSLHGYFSLQGSRADELCSMTINERTECSHQGKNPYDEFYSIAFNFFH